MGRLFRAVKEELLRTLQAGWRSGVGKNAASLYVIQFANYILPLILVPYLVRVLGPEHFGLVAFGQGLIAYFNIFVDYGFALSATRRISVERDLSAISRTTASVWVAKGLLCVLAFIILSGLITVVPKLKELSILLLALYGVVIGNALFPIWLFQGLERMVFIAAINLAMRLLVVAGVFTLVRRPEHYLLYAGLTSLGSIGAGIAGMAIAFYKFKLRLLIPSWADIRQAFKEGWLLFLSTASVTLYTAGNAFILGLLTDPTVVGYYSAAEKIVKGVMNLLGPVRQAAYPRFSKLALESKDRAMYWGKRMMFVMGGLGSVLSLVLLFGAPLIVRVLLGPEYIPSIGVLRVLAMLPLLVGISNVLGIQVMLPFRKDRAFMMVLFSACVTNVVFAVLLAPYWHAVGMATAVLITETMVTLPMLFYLQHCGLNPLSWKLVPEGPLRKEGIK